MLLAMLRHGVAAAATAATPLFSQAAGQAWQGPGPGPCWGWADVLESGSRPRIVYMGRTARRDAVHGAVPRHRNRYRAGIFQLLSD